ncbi:hypothetical protein [Paracidovorax sp. MALMAid1276]|uniref:hypothetical protein n=1 Tax=Paracidovorax sp. MALMAid1276 TaxID=3411631 RepID=UPI003B9CF018
MPPAISLREHALLKTAKRHNVFFWSLLLLAGANAKAETVPPPLATSAAAPAAPLAHAQAHATQMELIGTLGGERRSEQLVFSPRGDRFAHVHDAGLELWQTQPLKRLSTATASSGLGIRQVLFSASGQLHFLDGRNHAWITSDLRHGVSNTAVDLLSPDGRHALRTGLREGEDGFIPRFYNATSDVYDLLEQRSVCQFPAIARTANIALTTNWFAAQLAPTGPQPPKPLAVCDLASGRSLIMPFGNARTLVPTLDPESRWLLVHASGPRPIGLPDWQESKLFALPLRQSAFETATSNQAYPCADLPCGQPAALPTKTQLPEHPVVSVDGLWLAEWGSDRTVKLIKGPGMQQVAVFHHARHESGPNHTTGGRRVVFSANSRWMGLQAGAHLYRVDLQHAPLNLEELTPPSGEFDLRGISSDGLHWLVLQMPPARGALRGAVWRTRQP